MAEFPEDKACKTWAKGDATFSTVQHPSMGHYCGYVRYPSRFLVEDGYRGILTYAPVHGGLTLAKDDGKGMIYGFDCAHADDDRNPSCCDLVWLIAECARMDIAIRTAKEYEADYLACETNEARAVILDAYRAACGFPLPDLGIMAILNAWSQDI